MGLLSLIDTFQNEFDRMSGAGNVVTYPLIIQKDNKDYICCFSVRVINQNQFTRPLIFGLADINTEEIVLVKPCVEEDIFLIDYNKKYPMAKIGAIDEHKPLLLFAMLLVKYKEEGVLDADMYEKYLISVSKVINNGLEEIYEEGLYEWY